MVETMLAVVALETVVWLVIYIIVAGLVFALLYWAVTKLPLKEPFKTAANVALVLGSVIVLICILMWAIGRPLIK